MTRTVTIPTADGSAVYFERGATQAVLFSPSMSPTPTMHRRDDVHWMSTECGRQVFDVRTGLTLPAVTLLRKDQAVLFCRPCRRCWP